jgi:hypothetical protein
LGCAIVLLNSILWNANKTGLDYTKISRAAAGCRFRRNPELVAEVAQAVKPFLDGVVLNKRLCMTITRQEFAALFAGQSRTFTDFCRKYSGLVDTTATNYSPK